MDSRTVDVKSINLGRYSLIVEEENDNSYFSIKKGKDLLFFDTSIKNIMKRFTDYINFKYIREGKNEVRNTKKTVKEIRLIQED